MLSGDYSFAKVCIVLVTYMIVDASPLAPTRTEWMNVSADAVRSADSAKSAESTMPLLDWILTYSAIEDQNMVIDDSITAREQLHSVKRTVASRKKRNIVNFQELVLRKWPAPEYTIKYKFSGEHDAAEQQTIRDAIAHWEQHTCIRWQEIDLQTSINQIHLVFSNGSHAGHYSSHIGKSPDYEYEQIINIGSVHLQTPGIAISLLGHSLGLFSLHMRQDRDAYVTVNIENVTPISIPLFSKLEWALLDTLGLPYDYGSIMHISGKSFLKDGLTNETTLDATDGYSQMAMGQKTILSFFDAKIINLAYCSDVCPEDSIWPCARSGYQDPNNCTKCRCIEGFGGDFCQQPAESSAGCNPNNPEVIVTSTTEECVESPNYPAGYTSGDFCNWYFLAPQGQTIDLTFRDQFDVFVMPPHQVCYHWIEIRTKTGLNTRGPRFCSNTRPSDTFTSESNEAVVSFNSPHPTSAQQNAGFRLCYKLSSL